MPMSWLSVARTAGRSRPHPAGAPRRLLLVTLLLATTALAGCHDLPHEPAVRGGQDEAAAPDAPPAEPAPTGRNELPRIAITATVDRAAAALHVHLDGDSRHIAVHSLDFGDGSEPIHGDGAPAQRYTHTYPAPPNFRHDDLAYQATLTLRSALGHARVVHTDIVIPAPPNQAPLARLEATVSSGPGPLRTSFSMSGTDSDGTIESWQLDLGDGSDPVVGPGISTRPFQHEYRTIGTHTARLSFIDDRGLPGHHEVDIEVWPPQDVRVWSVHGAEHRVHVQDGNGTTIADHNVRRPTCGRATTCETPVDVATGAGRAYVALSRPQANGTVWVLDAESGRGAYHVNVGHQPDAVWTDNDGNAWVTHTTSGLIARVTPTSHRAAFFDTPLDASSEKTAAFSEDGRHAWFLGRADPALLVHIDLDSRQVGTLALPAGLDPVTLTHQNAYNVALVAGRGGRVLYVAWEETLPVVQDLVDVGLGVGATVSALTCHGRDHCWLATTPGDAANARVIALPARPDPGATPVRTLPEMVLPQPLSPAGLTAHAAALIITIGGDGAHGIVIADPATATITKWQVTNTSAPGGTHFATHPAQPHLVYLDAPDLPGWRLVDTRSGDVVHAAKLPFIAGALAVAQVHPSR